MTENLKDVQKLLAIETLKDMVPIEDLEAIQALEEQKDADEAERILSDSDREFIPWEQAKRELAGD